MIQKKSIPIIIVVSVVITVLLWIFICRGKTNSTQVILPANTYEQRIEALMPEIDEVVHQYQCFYDDNRELFDKLEKLIIQEDIEFFQVVTRFIDGRTLNEHFYLEYSVDREPVESEVFQYEYKELYELLSIFVNVNESPFYSIWVKRDLLVFNCTASLNSKGFGVQFRMFKNDDDKYNGTEEIGNDWKIGWWIRGLT